MTTTSTSPTSAPSGTVQLSRAWAVACVLGLVAVGLSWELWLAPLRPGGSWWALKVLPLALTLSGLLKHRMYTYRWLSLLVWLYMAEGLVRATSESGWSAGLAWAQTLLCVLLFLACVVHIRHRLRSAAPTPSAGDVPR